MAAAALSALIAGLLKKMASPLLEKFGSICRVNKELNNLCSTFTAIQAVLKDAEEQQWTSNTIRDWLDKLEDVAYEVEDILDDFATEDLRRRVEIRNSTTKKVCDFFTPWKNTAAFKSKMSNKVRKVVERLDVIAKEKSNYNLRQEDVDRRKETEARVQTHSFVDKSEVYGRKEDKDKLVHLLVNRGDEEEENVSVVPIVGMGGLGKTTLAKLVYNDVRVSSYFDQRTWVFVSEKFDSAEIMKAIIESDQGRCDVERMESLQSCLRKTVSGKRYLLVLDDVWNENQEAWLQLKSLLNVGEKGSKIIATTRSNIVANMMGTLPTHHLEGLPEEDCWSLFKDLTIQDMPDLEKWSSDERSQTLPHIKRLQIRNCPKLTQMPHLPSVEILRLTGCNEMLLMSIRNYTSITTLFIGGFPEMISLPEGLLKNLTLIEDLKIVDCPKLKSLSQDVHDLPAIRSLGLLNCGEVESLMEGVRNLTSLKSFWVSGCNHLTSLPDEGFQGLTSLHDLWITDCDKLRSLGEGLQVQHLNSLVLFDVSGCPELAALPESLFNLTALKTLQLRKLPKLASLSEEIGNLASLEQLQIEECPHLLRLPESLQKVTTLRCLRIKSCPSLERRCAKEKGEDWNKIAHVSVILINGQCVQEVRYR